MLPSYGTFSLFDCYVIMDEQYLQQLLERYQQGTISAEELKLLEQWYADLAKTEEPFFRQEAGKEAHLQCLLQNIHEGISTQASPATEQQPPVRKLWYRWVAAAVLLLLCTGAWLWYQLAQNQPAAIAQSILVPPGKTYRITLPDSSTVWLSGGTQLQYLNDYGRQTRTVSLQKGKAFFDVRKDAAHPFIVSTGSIQTKVLGTSFTVNVENNRQPSVAVATGKVAVSLGSKTLSVLSPGKQLKADPATGAYEVSDHPATLVNAWTQEELPLAGVDFTALSQAFETFYNVRIHTNSQSIQQNKYTIMLKRNVAAVKVLTVICSLYHNQYLMMPDGSYMIY